MQDFIQSVTSKLGIGEDQAKSATGGLLNFLNGQDGADIQALIAKLPGAESLMQSAGSSGGGGGMLGGVTGALGQGGGVLAAVQGSGLNPNQASSFVRMLIEYARDKAGPETVNRVLDKVPALKTLA